MEGKRREEEKRESQSCQYLALPLPPLTWVLQVGLSHTLPFGSFKPKEKVGDIWRRFADTEGQEIQDIQLHLPVHLGNSCRGRPQDI